MQKYRDTLTDRNGNSLPGVSVLVKNYPAGTTAVLYSDNGVTQTPNPLTSDAYGVFSFYAADGRYSLTISGPRVTTFTVDDVPMLEDLADGFPALAAPTGSGLVGFQQSDTNAVPRTLQSKARDVVSVMDYMSDAVKADVMAGTKLLSVSSAFALAFMWGGPSVFVPSGTGWNYAVGSTINVPTGCRLVSNGAQFTLMDGANCQMIGIAQSADGVVVDGLKLDGNKANNTTGYGVLVGSLGCTNLSVKNCSIKSFNGDGIRIRGITVSGIKVEGNYVSECGTGGITADDLVTKFSFSRNFTWLNNTHGVGIVGTGTNGVFNANVSWDNGQGTPNADNLTGYASGNDSIVVSNNVSVGGLNNGIHFGGTNITYSGNTAKGAAMYGIAHSPPALESCDNLVFSNNQAYGCGLSGFNFVNSTGGNVTGNQAHNNGEYGFRLNSLGRYTFTGNTAFANAQGGCVNGTASNTLTFIGNNFSGNTGPGLSINNVQTSHISFNQLNNNTTYGLTGGGTEAGNLVSMNNTLANGTAGVNTLASTTIVGVIAPMVVGGSSTTQSVIYKTTTGVGATGADHIFQVGSNGSLEAMRLRNDGRVGINRPAPLAQVDIGAASGTDALRLSNTSLAARAWMMYNITNGTATDLYLHEYGDTSGTRAIWKAGGYFGLGGVIPTARLHLSAGAAAAGNAPLKFTSGTNLTTAETGAMEYNGTNLLFTRTGTTREGVLTQSAVTTEVVVTDTTVTVNINGTTYKLLAKA